MARQRDYAAEYARRRKRAEQTGTTVYRRRVDRYLEQHPGAPKAAARGHRSAADLLAALRAAPTDGTLVNFIGLDRQRDGTWRRGSFTLLVPDEPEREFIIGPHKSGAGGLDRMADASQIIADRGLFLIGGKYLQQMLAWIDEDLEDLDWVEAEE